MNNTFVSFYNKWNVLVANDLSMNSSNKRHVEELRLGGKNSEVDVKKHLILFSSNPAEKAKFMI